MLDSRNLLDFSELIFSSFCQVRAECSAQRVYIIFRTLGLRHLCVTDSNNRYLISSLSDENTFYELTSEVLWLSVCYTDMSMGVQGSRNDHKERYSSKRSSSSRTFGRKDHSGTAGVGWSFSV